MNQIHCVLDLDETLVHGVYSNNTYDSLLRPYVYNFLDFCFKHFASVNIWTAASKEWWEFNREKHFSNYSFERILTEDRCSEGWNYNDIEPIWKTYKPLKKMWRQRKYGATPDNTIIIDDDPDNSIKNYGNALIIKPWNGDSNDRELLYMKQTLTSIMTQFNECGSIRKIRLNPK